MRHFFSKLAVRIFKALIVPVWSLILVYIMAQVNLDKVWWAIVLVVSTFGLASLFSLVALSGGLARRSRTLKKAPGARCISFVEFLYSPEDVEKTFRPILADCHKEYFRALAAHYIWRSRWINLKYRYRFTQAMGLCKVFQLVDRVIGVVSSVLPK